MAVPKIDDRSTQTKLRPLRKEAKEKANDSATDGKNGSFAIDLNEFIQ